MPPRHGRDTACLQAARLLKWGLLAIRLSQIRTEIAGSTIRRLPAEWMGLFPKPTANPVTLGLLVYWAVEVACSTVGERMEEVAMAADEAGRVVVAL